MPQSIPADRRYDLESQSNASVSPALDEASQADRVMQEFVGCLRELFAARRQAPRGDLIAALLRAEETGDHVWRTVPMFRGLTALPVAGTWP
jgi:cytochrome P450